MSVDHAMVQCPACQGRQGGHGFIRRVEGCGAPEWIPCQLCRGDGTVTRARGQAYERGARIGAAREAKDWSLREFAQQLGVKPADASDIEHGRATEVFLQRAEMLVGLRAAVSRQ